MSFRLDCQKTPIQVEYAGFIGKQNDGLGTTDVTLVSEARKAAVHALIEALDAVCA